MEGFIAADDPTILRGCPRCPPGLKTGSPQTSVFTCLARDGSLTALSLPKNDAKERYSLFSPSTLTMIGWSSLTE